MCQRVHMFLSFSQGKKGRPKNRAHLRGFERLSVQRHRASGLCGLKFKTILVQDVFYIFLCCLSIDFMKAVKAFSTSFFGTLRAVLKH